VATPSKTPAKTTISTPTSKAKTSAVTTPLKSGLKTPSSVTKPKSTSVKTPSVTSSPSTTASPLVVKPPTIKGGTKVTLSKPATSVAASTATSSSESSATTLSEDIGPAPVVEDKKQVEVVEPTVEESPREVDPIGSVEETTEEPELEFDNYEIDKGLLENQQDNSQEEGDIIEFVEDSAEHVINDDTEFPLEPHEQMLALEDQ